MKRGAIPGFYFDPEKQKYFKIQANHVAPVNAPYSQSAVKRQKRLSRQHRIDHRLQECKIEQTVHRASVLAHASIAGITLSRELGHDRLSAILQARDVCYVSHLHAHSTTVRPCPPNAAVSDLVPLPRSRALLVAASHSLSRSTMEMTAWSPDAGPDKIDLNHAPVRHVVGLNSSIASISTAESISLDGVLIVVCGHRPVSPGNVYCGLFPTAETATARGVYLKLGPDTGTLWSSSMHPDSLHTAIGGTSDLFVIDQEGTLAAHQRLPSETRSVEWLDANTVVYSQRGSAGDRGVHLWDIRSLGKALRFRCSRVVTGIVPLPDSLRLIISDNKSSNVFDTRMDRRPLTSFAHASQGPQLHSALLGEHVFAALDCNSVVQTYSLRNGRSIGPLVTPSRNGSLTRLMSSNIDSGTELYACHSDQRLVQWSFQ